MAVLGKVGATGLLALMGLVGSVRADSAKHAATTLDWTLAPFKGLLSKLVVYTVGKENTSCLKTDEYVKQVSTDFINFSRLYMSPDFPRGYAKTYSAMPLLIYVAVLFYVLWIIITIGWCVFRCCCRKAKCCNPVLYAKSGKQRRKKECCCACCYGFSMILFLGTTALTIVAVLLSDKLLKSADEKLVDPLDKYMHNLPARLNTFAGNYSDNMDALLAPVLGSLNLDQTMDYLGKYMGYRFEAFLGTVMSAVRYWGSFNNMDEFNSSKDEWVKKQLNDINEETVNTSIKNLLTRLFNDLSDNDIESMKYAGDALTEVREKIDGLKDELDEINSGAYSIFKKDGSGEYVILNELEGCFESFAREGEDGKWREETPAECFAQAFKDGITLENFTSAISEMIKGEEEDGEYPNKERMEEMAEQIDEYLGQYGKYINMVRDFLKGDPTKFLEFIYEQIGLENTSSGNEDEDPEVSGGSMEVYSNDSLPNLPYDKIFKVLSWMIKNYIPLFCGVFAGIMFFFYIFPLMLALCLRKRNRKQGKCACKAWIKCTTCCCAIWTPYSLILCGVSMVLAPIVYFISMAYIMSSDSSTFDAAGETPAPIGSAFSTCILGGQMDKRVLFRNMFADEDGKVPETTSALINLGTEFLSKTIAPLLFCERPGATDTEKDGITLQEVIPLDDETTDSYDDEELMKKYGTFFTAILSDKNSEVLQKAVNEGINDDNIANLLCGIMSEDDGEKYCPTSGNKPKDVLMSYVDGKFVKGLLDGVASWVKDTSSIDTGVLQGAAEKFAGWDLSELHMFFSVAPGEPLALVSDWNKVKILEDFKEGMAKIGSITGLRASLDQDYRNDFDTLVNGCKSKSSCGEVLSFENPFYNLMMEISDVISGASADENVQAVNGMIDKMKSLYGSTGEQETKVKNALLAAEKVKCASEAILKGAASSISNIKNDDSSKLNEDNVIEAAGKSYDALRGNVSGILANIKKNTEGGFEDRPAINDLMTCYPLGALSTYGLDSVNKTSNTQTMSAVGLMVFVLACLLMMIVANCGPLVYNERYKRKCCCCCYQEAKAPPPTKAYTVRSGNTSNVVQPAAIDVVVDNNDGRVVVRQPGNGYYPSSNIQTYHSTNSMPPSYAPMPEGGQYRMVYVADSRDLQGSKRPRRTVK